MAKDKFWFRNITPQLREIFQTGKNSVKRSEGTGTVIACTVPLPVNIDVSIYLTINNVSYVPDLRVIYYHHSLL